MFILEVYFLRGYSLNLSTVFGLSEVRQMETCDIYDRILVVDKLPLGYALQSWLLPILTI